MTVEQTSSRKRKSAKGKGSKRRARVMPFVLRWLFRAAMVFAVLALLWVILYRVVAPPTTYYIWSEERRLGHSADREWVDADDIAPVMFRSVVAAEDANYCTHWGFDMRALRAAIADGGTRGASTISQQTVKNVFLWHGRTYSRKVMEALLTPLVEAVWPKRRILEVYLNVAEFDEGVFGVKAAARHYFGTAPSRLTATQAARLAAILPSPKTRSASEPGPMVRKRAASIADGAATIARDGRAACFE